MSDQRENEVHKPLIADEVSSGSPELRPVDVKYANLAKLFIGCDRVIPADGLEMWGGGLDGKRGDKQKEFKADEAAVRVREVLQHQFPEVDQQVQILDAAIIFLDKLLTNVDPSDYDTVPLGQLDRFLSGFPQNIISRLGSDASAAVISEIFHIGTHAIEYHENKIKNSPPHWKEPFPNGALGTVAMLVGEAIPESIAGMGVNRDRVLAKIDNTAKTTSSYDLHEKVDLYHQINTSSRQLPDPGQLQEQMIQMEEALIKINPKIAEQKFKDDKVKILMETAEKVANSIPDTQVSAILDVLNESIKSELKHTVEVDPIAGHFLIDPGIKILARGIGIALERGSMTREQFENIVHIQTGVISEVIRQLNAQRIGRNDRETDDWKSIGLALDRNIVQRIIDVSSATQNQLTTEEITGWIRGSTTPIWWETWRMDGLMVTGEIIAHHYQKEQPSAEITDLIIRTLRTANEFPEMLYHRGALRLRDALFQADITLSATELSDALIEANRCYTVLRDDTEEVDHRPIRAPHNETRAIQMERGFEFAAGVEAFRERVLRAFLTDANKAVQITRGCALIEDAFRPNEFKERPTAKVQEIFSSFIDPMNIDTFMNGLTKIMEVYDQQATIGQRKLIIDAISFILRTKNPTETLIRLFEGQMHTIKSAAWFGRLVGDNKETLDMLDIEPALGLLTDKGEESNSEPNTEVALVLRNESMNLIPQITESSVPLGRALQAYMIAHGGGENGIRAVREKIGSLELHTTEDAQAFLPSLTQAMSRFLHVPMEELQGRMVSVKPIAGVIEQAAQENPIAGIILKISSIFGGAEVPHMSYAPQTDTIFVNEESHQDYSVDELGEEIAHWIREVARPYGEDSDPSVHEFFGFLGRRIVRAALDLPDVVTKPEDLAEALVDQVHEIAGQEIFHYIDTGFENSLRSTYAHLIGYVAASNIPLDQITPELVRMREQEIKDKYFSQYGLGEDWFIQEEQRLKEAFAKEVARLAIFPGRIVRLTTVHKPLKALYEAKTGKPLPADYVIDALQDGHLEELVRQAFIGEMKREQVDPSLWEEYSDQFMKEVRKKLLSAEGSDEFADDQGQQDLPEET